MAKQYSKQELDANYKGECPICDRPMYKLENSIDKHHFVPKSRKGKESEYVHRICHRKIHSLFTEKQCEKEYSDPELVRTHPDMQKFIEWVSKKDPLFYDGSVASKSRGK